MAITRSSRTRRMRTHGGISPQQRRQRPGLTPRRPQYSRTARATPARMRGGTSPQQRRRRPGLTSGRMQNTRAIREARARAARMRMRTQREVVDQQRRRRMQRLNQRRGLTPRRLNNNLSNNSNSNNNNNYNNNRNNSNNNRNKNVATWYNKDFNPVTKKNIKPKKRAYIGTNVGNNGKIKTVFNKRGLKTFVRKVRDNFRTAKSPITRRAISGRNIRPYTSKKKSY
jgi:hypothetical protein